MVANTKFNSAPNIPSQEGSQLILPFADAPSIVQAHQKDNQTEAVLNSKVERFLKSIKGQLFTNAHPEGISIAVKAIYLGLTTLVGKRTLGEEYVDLIYVSRNGRKLVGFYRRLLFVISYAGGPYIISKLLKKWCSEDAGEGSYISNLSYRKILDMLLNLHLVGFYLKGAYYDVFKRISGLRYAVAHNVNSNEAKFRKSSSDTYKFLGYILLLQMASKSLPIISRSLNQYLGPRESHKDKEAGLKDYNGGLGKSISGIPEESQILHIDLSSEHELPFIPSQSRVCILCLNPMIDPSCPMCGHLFCWNCILNWCKERPECPLCRQKCLPQQILAVR